MIFDDHINHVSIILFEIYYSYKIIKFYGII